MWAKIPNVATNERQSQVQPQMQDLERRTKVSQDRVKLLEERETTPHNEVISSLKQFQLDIQGRIDHRPAKKSVEKSSTDAPVEKCTKQSTKVREVTELDAENDDGMEVTDHDYPTKIHEKKEGPRFEQRSREQRATRRAPEKHVHVEREANERPRRDVTASLLQFQSQIEGRMDRQRSKSPVDAEKEGGKIPSQKVEESSHSNASRRKKNPPRKFESMLRNLEELKLGNEDEVSTMQNLDRMRKQNEEKVSAMISALSPEEATEMPSWFAEFARQQEDKFQELMHISEQRNKEIKRLNDDTAGPSQVRSFSLGNDEKKDDLCLTNV
jgi:hypothetical protein